MSIELATYWLWAAWAVSWYFAALRASRAVARPRSPLNDFHRIIASAG